MFNDSISGISAIPSREQEEFEETKGVIRIRKIEEGQATQWPKEKEQKNKQRSTKNYTEY